MNNKRILHITLTPFQNDSRVQKEAVSLHSAGFEVSILAIQNAEMNLPTCECYEAFELRRLKISYDRPRSILLQGLKYIEYFLRALVHLFRFNPHVIHCHDLRTLPFGLFFTGKVVYDSHEFQRGRNGLGTLGRVVTGITENILSLRTDAALAVNREIARLMNRHLGIETEYLLNADYRNNLDQCLDDDISLRRDLSLSDSKKIVVYPGGFSPGRGLMPLLDAAPFLSEDVVLALVGYGSLENTIKKRIEEMGLNEKVFVLSAVPSRKVAAYISSADLGIMPTENVAFSYRLGLGNKLFHFIAAGLPVAVSDQPAKRALVEEYGLGIVINPDNPKAMAEQINMFLSDEAKINLCRENVRKALDSLNWEREEKKLIRLYQRLLPN